MTRFITCCLLSAGLLGTVHLASAHSAGDHSQHAAPAPRLETAEVSVADVPLLDQHGRTVRLQADLLADKIVVISFIYTSCTTVCPVVSSIMAKVQQQLGSRVGREVQLVSISIDPQRDNPQRLAAYARSFQKGPGWSWLTGSTPSVEATLKGLGSWSADPGNHAPLILVGDGNSRQWTRYYGFTDPALLTHEVEKLSGLRSHAAHTAIALEQQP